MAQLRRKPSISKLQTLATDIMCSVARYAHDKDSIGSRKRMIAHAEELLLEARGPLEHLFALSGQVSLFRLLYKVLTPSLTQCVDGRECCDQSSHWDGNL